MSIAKLAKCLYVAVIEILRTNKMTLPIQLYQKIKESGGFSHCVRTGKSPKRGDKKFAVAFSKTRERKIPLVQFCPTDLIHYIIDNSIPLSRNAVHLGAWVSGGFVYLDCSIVVTDEEIATKIALRNGQIAIFSFETMSDKTVQRDAA